MVSFIYRYGSNNNLADG